ncbi:ATP-binding protein [Tabrizicola sp.]|uniref:ATP-binding protein n=1 Tax=Tabrizicola sp. TaxID=2005166 RepID=UPI002FDDB73E
MARINLPKFISEHYRAGISARDVIREALTNSIQAGAREISVELIFSAAQPDLFDGDERRVLEKIIIEDDGEGFTDENLNYFDEVFTNHKDAIGGKGVGRLAFLKYASIVNIQSQLPTHMVTFDYTPEFTVEAVTRLAQSGPARTRISLSGLKERINTQVTKLVNSLCDDLRLFLFLKHQAGHSISLRFTHNSKQPFEEVYQVSGSDIQATAKREFEFLGQNFCCYLFRDEPPRKGIVAMLCADELCIEELQISKRFDVCRHLIFVTSDYFNKRSDLVRQELKLPKNESEIDFISPISREKLFPKLQQVCLEMIESESSGDIQEFKTSNVEKLRKYYPYINLASLGEEATLLDADQIVKTYRAQLARQEDQLMDKLEDGIKPSLDDVSHLASEDLARFIVHRALVIDSLSNMPADAAEEAIHNAILPKKSRGDEIRENNVWLVDDKFLSYSSIFSDATLRKIVEEVGQLMESRQLRKPDIAAFFSKDSESQPNKLVIIEFKKPGADIFESNKALTQCRLYAGELADRIPSVREVFAFAVVEISEEFHRDMKQTGFRDVFSLQDKVVYNDFQIGTTNEVPLHLYVMPASALVKDARARNKVFEDVLRFNLAGKSGPTIGEA